MPAPLFPDWGPLPIIKEAATVATVVTGVVAAISCVNQLIMAPPGERLVSWDQCTVGLRARDQRTHFAGLPGKCAVQVGQHLLR